MVRDDYHETEDVTCKHQVDMARIIRSECVYKTLWNHILAIYEAYPGNSTEKEEHLLQLARQRLDVNVFLRLENKSFGFLHHQGRLTGFSVRETFSRGIVIRAETNQVRYLTATIQAIRHTLPIQVFYAGDRDLHCALHEYLGPMWNDVEQVDVTTILNDRETRIEGWAIKPCAMLATLFEEVILLDAGVFFLRVSGGCL